MYSCVCPQQQLVGQPLTLGCNPAAIGRPTLACVYSETHMCMPTAAIGRPFLDPWVQPSIDFFFNTCVCAHSRNWPAKVLNVQNLHLASSLGYSATHMCVFTAALGRPTLSCPLLQHMCVCAYSSNRSAKAFFNAQSFKTCSAPDMCVSETHMCMPTSSNWSANPLPLGATLNGLLLKHTCVCAHSSNWSAEVVGCSEPSLGLLIEFFCKTDVCVFTAAIGRLTLR